ncbi:MAG: pectate lyase, partial [Planctomycetota bacterium]
MIGRVPIVLCSVTVALAAGTAWSRESEPLKSFPDAQGWAAYTPGGRGGRIIRVTNLDPDGPGSFADAVRAQGPRIVVFEVGGVIDLQRKSISITEPFVTVAGQTAPNPGITFIRGGLGISTHD